jgi:hypothetical protein
MAVQTVENNLNHIKHKNSIDVIRVVNAESRKYAEKAEISHQVGNIEKNGHSRVSYARPG